MRRDIHDGSGMSDVSTDVWVSSQYDQIHLPHDLLLQCVSLGIAQTPDALWHDGDRMVFPLQTDVLVLLIGILLIGSLGGPDLGHSD